MSQGEPGIELDTSLGYMLKAAASALHSAMEAVLRPLGMTITHYACLELLAQRPGLSNSELARGTFVTRSLDAGEQDQLRRLLTVCIAALSQPPAPAT
jgi:hypothetical protein